MDKRQQILGNKIRQMWDTGRTLYRMILALEEKNDKGYLNMLGMVMKFLSESMKLKVLNDTTGYVTRLGRRRDNDHL